MGTPQYGGNITMRLNATVTGWDAYNLSGSLDILCNWAEILFINNWTTDPATFNFKTMFTPPDYTEGLLAKSWELPDSNTFIAHLKQGINWQNLARHMAVNLPQMTWFMILIGFLGLVMDLLQRLPIFRLQFTTNCHLSQPLISIRLFLVLTEPMWNLF